MCAVCQFEVFKAMRREYLIGSLTQFLMFHFAHTLKSHNPGPLSLPSQLSAAAARPACTHNLRWNRRHRAHFASRVRRAFLLAFQRLATLSS